MKKNVNKSSSRTQICIECGKAIKTKNSNVCDACLEKILSDKK